MEGIGADLEVMKPVPLAAGHIDAIRAIGRERSYDAGDMIARVGDPMDRFMYVVEGEMEVLDPKSEKRMGDATLGPGQFVGELSFLSGGNYFLATRAVSRTVTIEVARDAHDGFVGAVMVDRGDLGLAPWADEPTGERAGPLAHILFRVAVTVSEREERHELAGQILIRRACAVANAVQPEQHRRVGQHRLGERVEIAEFEGAQHLVLLAHPFRGRHLLGRRREMVVPQQGELLVDRLAHGGHPSHPPRGEVGHMIEQRLSELLQRGIGCTVAGRCGGDRHRARRGHCPGSVSGSSAWSR